MIATRLPWPPRGHLNWISWIVPLLALVLFYRFIIAKEQFTMRSYPQTTFLIAVAASLAGHRGVLAAAEDVDLGWYKPNATVVNDLQEIVGGQGVWGYIYDTSETPDEKYGVYNWCNMPHVRKREYKKPAAEYELQYVEVIQRHHKRTVYASNAFPVESYGWDCGDQGLFFYGKPFPGHQAANSYWKGYISPINPFTQTGFKGTCQFPQITSGGLEDSWQHGKDLYEVYHDLLGFLPSNANERVSFRVTNNQITSQVAGMLINGMFGTEEDYPLSIQPSGVDSLEPQFSCPTGSNLFNAIKSGSNWTSHLTSAGPLYSTLDNISGVSPTDSGFHVTLDHYYDNLSARQCHSKPFPCKIVNGANSTTCITQPLADEVYRLGHYEYSYIYRDDPRSLPASVASYGVWIAELANNIRNFIDGKSNIIYRHNVAHDGSMSRLLSILQIDQMVWPGMGSEVVFEVYKKRSSPTTHTTMVTATPTIVAPNCNRDNCLRQLIQQSSAVSAFCPTYTASSSFSGPLPTFVSQCGGSASRISSACSCIVTPTSTSSTSSPTPPPATSASGHYVRVLWKGQTLRSSNPSLGLMEMLPLETLLAYFDGLVGDKASLVKGKCGA